MRGQERSFRSSDRHRIKRERNARGEANAQAIHASKPRSARPYRAYRAELAKGKGAEVRTLVDLHARFAPKLKRRRPEHRAHRRGRGRSARTRR